MSIEGLFREKLFPIAGENLTLDQIEFEKLFERNSDPRIHFVLNCGAVSCPTLNNEAISPQELDEQLDFAISMVMDRDDYVYVDHAEKEVRVSKIFDWYRDQFELNGSIRTFINTHRFVSIPDDYDIGFFEYDWTLNDVR